MFSDATSLGWDPTMTYVPASGTEAGYYTIQVPSQDGTTVTVYRTLDIISDIGTNTTRGRGTRVWKIVKTTDPKGKTAVLKESWIDSERDREGDILKQLRDSAKTDDQKNTMSLCFLTVQVNGDVMINSKADTSLSQDVCDTLVGRGDRFVLDDSDYDQLLVHIERISKTPEGTGAHTHPQGYRVEAPVKRHTYRTKTRYRVVFNEYCTRLSDEPSLITVFSALGITCLGASQFARYHCSRTDCWQALECMHELGWVHRDISAANILLYEEPRTEDSQEEPSVRVILADLEYAKRIGPTKTDKSRSDGRIVRLFNQQLLHDTLLIMNGLGHCRLHGPGGFRTTISLYNSTSYGTRREGTTPSRLVHQRQTPLSQTTY